MAGGIKQWPEADRPRERLLRQGETALSDTDLLAVILRTGDGAAGTSAVDMAREILATFDGDLSRLAAASLAEICRVRGVGPAKAAGIRAALALGSRLAEKRLGQGEHYSSPSQVYHHYGQRFRREKKEHFLILLLDGKNRLIREVSVSIGSLNQSLVHPREVFSPAVRDSAAAVILVHNHPSGDPAPSREDLEITRRLRQSGETLGIRVLDHIIIGHDTYVSLADRGEL
jgi:DNA repair protein RadC